MDELIFDNERYVSSKRAAEITGYAKDYVGQLCREGRVTAKLVGRNWYVLESSLRAHRFGTNEEAETPSVPATAAPEAPERPQTLVPEPIPPVITPIAALVEPPRYIAEEPAVVPPLAPKPAPPAPSPAIEDMQAAWREWFGKTPPAPALPDGSDDFTPSALPAVLPGETTEAAPEPDPEPQVREEPTYEPEPAAEPEEVPVSRSYATLSTGETVPDTGVPVVDLTPRATKQVKGRFGRVSCGEERERSKNAGALRTLLLVTAGVAALVALVGTGNADRLLGDKSFKFGPQKEIIDYLGGTRTYDSDL